MILPIYIYGSPVLRKTAANITPDYPGLQQFIADMWETMYDADGVGLAAPQVGVRKRVVVIDVEDGNQYVLINPEILETSGSQTGQEGCLSVPGKCGQVTRADHVKAKALNENMEEYVIEADGLLARCILHECDHLDGKLYVDLVEGELQDTAGEDEVTQ